MRVAFIKAYILISRELSKIYKLCPVFILAVAALETGYGQRVKGNNFFGIKANSAWKGKKMAFATHEYLKDNVRHQLVDVFRKYDSPNESFQDFCMLIRTLYPQCIGVYDKTVCELIVANPKRRYATSPHYSKVLTAVYQNIRTYLDEHPDI